jgi:hypothetical protein
MSRMIAFNTSTWARRLNLKPTRTFNPERTIRNGFLGSIIFDRILHLFSHNDDAALSVVVCRQTYLLNHPLRIYHASNYADHLCITGWSGCVSEWDTLTGANCPSRSHYGPNASDWRPAPSVDFLNGLGCYSSARQESHYRGRKGSVHEYWTAVVSTQPLHVVRLHVRLYLCGRFRSQLEISWNHSVPYLQERKENSRVCALTFWRIEGGEKGSK